MQINYHIALVERGIVTKDIKFTVNQRKVYREPEAYEVLNGLESYDIESDFSKYVYMVGDSLYIQGHCIVNDKYKSNEIIRSLSIYDFSHSTMYVKCYIFLFSETYKVSCRTTTASSYWKLLLKLSAGG